MGKLSQKKTKKEGQFSGLNTSFQSQHKALAELPQHSDRELTDGFDEYQFLYNESDKKLEQIRSYQNLLCKRFRRQRAREGKVIPH